MEISIKHLYFKNLHKLWKFYLGQDRLNDPSGKFFKSGPLQEQKFKIFIHEINESINFNALDLMKNLKLRSQWLNKAPKGTLLFLDGKIPKRLLSLFQDIETFLLRADRNQKILWF